MRSRKVFFKYMDFLNYKTFISVLVALYESPDKPNNALEYVEEIEISINHCSICFD